MQNPEVHLGRLVLLYFCDLNPILLEIQLIIQSQYENLSGKINPCEPRIRHLLHASIYQTEKQPIVINVHIVKNVIIVSGHCTSPVILIHIEGELLGRKNLVQDVTNCFLSLLCDTVITFVRPDQGIKI